MDRHERALIDTGEATPSRKQLQAYTSKMSGPIGLARSQFLTFILSSLFSSSIFPSHNKCHLLHPITRECQKHSTSTGTIALSKAVVPINTSSSGISRNLDKTSPTHATRYQTTPINLMHQHSSNCKT